MNIGLVMNAVYCDTLIIKRSLENVFGLSGKLCSFDCFVGLILFFYVLVPSRWEVNGGKRKEAESQQGQKADGIHLSPKSRFARNYF
ncbi:hypothetical protein RRU94_15635 [Domibacillus sp. DTU_2020_1001157_1_SI_ALB_TIR_016]|uniref:hypothetical protein n=1 Tax=Domibacillus sp. DTU_2020_1001157_1_SI_ALB_TIR_016 TaxID=3077789 RepID=UPI0028E91877|nr:hypothetical protein [Domibacillus sp. DTU_2020_1001157_1_SI_ALB_TIR_016]WNS82180.1 hypothetical protein RRU94_15635 [Domibacillus sp. DTU_2020_1001157_1_SI_ALB_TIR_016]